MRLEHHTRSFDALGWPFSVSSDDPRIVEYVTSLYQGLRTGSGKRSAHGYTIEVNADDEDAAVLAFDGERLTTDDDAGTLVTALVHDVNRRAIGATELLAAHAGGVVSGRDAIVLPASMESGKTTLTAGLVRAGFGYLTDEAVAFRWDTLELLAYAKPLSIDPGSWELFPELEPDVPLTGDGYKKDQWQIPPEVIRRGAVVLRATVRFVVFPSYTDGARTELVAITRGEALVELAKNTFRFRDHGRRALTALARLVESVECYRMPIGDLDDAVATIVELSGFVPEPAGSSS